MMMNPLVDSRNGTLKYVQLFEAWAEANSPSVAEVMESSSVDDVTAISAPETLVLDADTIEDELES